MKKTISIIILSLFLFTTSAFAKKPMSTIRTVYSLLKQYDEKSKKGRIIKRKINKYFALNKMARNAIVDHWYKMKRRQKKEYIKLMYKLLEKAVYKDTQENLRKGKTKFLGERFQGRSKAKVMTNIYITTEDMDINNDFMLRKRNGFWKVYDLFIDGASLTEDYRSQFNQIIAQDGFTKNKNSLFPRLRKAVKEDKDKWRKSWKSKKNRKKADRKTRPSSLNKID